MWGGKLCTAGGVQENTRCGWHSTAKGTMPWQLCLASVKPASIIQVFLEKCTTIPENSKKFKTEVILLKYAAKLTTGFGSMLFCCKLQLQVAVHY